MLKVQVVPETGVVDNAVQVELAEGFFGDWGWDGCVVEAGEFRVCHGTWGRTVRIL